MGQFKNYTYDVEYIIKQADPYAVIVWDYMDLDDLHSMAASTGSKLARYLLYAHELISDALSDAADDTIMFYGLDEQAQALALVHLDTWARGDLTDGHHLAACLASLMGAPEVSSWPIYGGIVYTGRNDYATRQAVRAVQQITDKE